MKKITLCVAAACMLFTSCSKKETATIAPTKLAVAQNAYSAGTGVQANKPWYKELWDWITKPLVDVNYKTGFYQATPTSSNPNAYKCNPGDAVCVGEFRAGKAGSGSSGVNPDGYADAAFVINDAGRLTMYISRATMSPATYTEHYADGRLNVPGPWLLQKEITEGLGLPSDYTIPAGAYVITQGPENTLMVTF